MQYRWKSVLLACLGAVSFFVMTGFESCGSGRRAGLRVRVTPHAGGGELTILGSGFKDGTVHIVFQNIPDGPINVPGGDVTAINGSFSKQIPVTCARSDDPSAANTDVYVVAIDARENIGRARTTASPAWICK